MNLWAQLIIPILVSALLTASLPGRWLVRGLAAWVLSPAIVFFLMIIGELITRPPVDNALGKALFGFMLIASIAAIPWLVLCLLGFGIGLVVRRRFRKQPGGRVPTSAPTTEARTTPDDAAIAIAPQERYGRDPSRDSGIRSLSAPHFETSPASAWREAHIGFANSGLTFDGLPVWTSTWRHVSVPHLRLPHPAHPNQIHDYDIYDIGPINQPIRFAAGELSNGVWGFYLPPNPSVSIFDSVDGSLRIEQRFHDPFDGRDEPARSWAVLIDAASQRMLVDCRGWESSHTVCNTDGTILLRLQSNGFESLFRIRPIARSFSNIGEAGPEQPLSDLAQFVEQARRLTDERERTPSYRRISADGSFRVDLFSVEWSNSHWVNSPRIIETASGRIVFDLWYSDWDAVASFPETHVVHLDLRRYRGGSSVGISLDFSRDQYRIHPCAQVGGAGLSGPIDQAISALRTHCHGGEGNAQRYWSSGVAPGFVVPSPNLERRGSAVPDQSRAMHPWRNAAMILAAALSAIVLIAAVAKITTKPAEQKLDRVPSMPGS